MKVWADFYAPNLRYHFKHRKISLNWRSVTERRHISLDLTDRFSLNFPDSCMAIRQAICESLGGFLCAKSEISLQTQENISKLAVCNGTQAYISRFN